jgi:hypothetical protein
MGYYTDYRLSIDDIPIQEVLSHITSNPKAYEYPEDLLEVVQGFTASTRWYEHEADLRNVSSAFPDRHFILTGCGEDNPDNWAKHFVDGKMQACRGKVHYEPFDENKLT